MEPQKENARMRKARILWCCGIENENLLNEARFYQDHESGLMEIRKSSENLAFLSDILRPSVAKRVRNHLKQRTRQVRDDR